MKGEDLYWGNSSSRNHSFCSIDKITDSGFTISTPKIFKSPSKSSSKYSYHASGQFHIKQLKNSRYSGKLVVENWDKNDCAKLIFRLITLPFQNYPFENKNLTRENSFGRAIMLEGEAAQNRLFAEFFLSKIPADGNLILPNFTLQMDENKIHKHWFPLNSEYTLIMRFVKFEKLEQWHPDSEAIVLPNNVMI